MLSRLLNGFNNLAVRTYAHHQTYLRDRDRLQAELFALEETAGIRERHAAFVEYNGDVDLRRLYFSVRDKRVRMALIAQSRRVRAHAAEFSRAGLADASSDLATLEARGFSAPWVIPGSLACVAVWIGYSLWSMPGALAGTIAGFFAGNAYVSHRKRDWRNELAFAKAEVEKRQAEVKRDESSMGGRPVFSDTEERSGGEDEGPQPEPNIHWYARLGDVEGIKLEIAGGASVELENGWGSRPLHRAAANSNVEIVRLLMSAGAAIDARNTLHGWMPIHYAAKQGCAEAIRVLLEAGSPVDAKDRYDREPIHMAAESGDPESVEVLLNAGAKIDTKAGPYQHEPIHEAARAGHPLTVQALLARGANPNAVNINGVRPLDLASLETYAANRKTIRLLEAAGAKRKNHA